MNRRIAHYELIEPIAGATTTGFWRVRDTVLERTVAMRLLGPASLVGCHEVPAERPASSFPTLVHPGILSSLAVGRDGNSIYLVYDFLPGRTLQDTLGHHEWTILECLELGIRVADALDYAHLLGFFHRDLQPASIHLDAVDLPWLMDADFVAMDSAASTDDSPESISEANLGRQVACRRDIQSLGAILRAMLLPPSLDQDQEPNSSPSGNGRQGFRGRGSRVPPEILMTCLRAMVNDVNNGFRTAGELAKELRRHRAQLRQNPFSPTIRDKVQIWSEQPERIAEAGILCIFIGLVISLWNCVGLASIFLQSIGFGDASFGERSAEIAWRLAVITGLILVPSVVVGMGTIAGRWWGIPAGLVGSVLGILWSAGVAAGVIDFTLAGLYEDRYFRQVIFSLVAMFPLITFMAYCLAYHARRTRSTTSST